MAALIIAGDNLQFKSVKKHMGWKAKDLSPTST